MANFSVSLGRLIEIVELGVIFAPEELLEKQIYSKNVNRPGLLLTGFYDYFDPTRIQIMGQMEFAYLEELTAEDRRGRIEELFKRQVPVVVISHGMKVFPEMTEFAKKYTIPLLCTEENTSTIMSVIISALSIELAPRITRHGVLIEVHGEGIFLIGESGVGKTETAIELVKRGHRLIADDAVELRRVSEKNIVGASPENIRYFVELRGIGILNIANMFGAGAIKPSGDVDMVIELQQWEEQKNYSRTGLEHETTDILGVSLPISVIPVRPGRNLAIIIETAAINNRQKKMGYNATKELFAKLGVEE